MGLNASTIPGDNGGIVSELTSPLKEDWIVQHADACGLTTIEVKNMWKRFQQLGCNQDGVLYAHSLPIDTVTDPFVSKIFKQFPKTNEGAITFQTFCAASKWLSDNSTDGKIRAVFAILNDGKPLDENILIEILSQVYLEDSQQSVKRAANVLLKQIDNDGNGFITEDQFASWVTTLPHDTLAAILNFTTSQQTDKDGMSASSTPVKTPVKKVARPTSLSGPVATDDQLMAVAKHVYDKDWLLFANKLGFTQMEVKDLQDNFVTKRQQAEELLKEWKNDNGIAATVSSLKRALVESDFVSVAEML
ncbi:uncharacterized protein LOC117103628 [Anneissia japonica]|uniref:uncharacterized protein LOC117103628 n=1 Tax=Anneissia japonica TaxID=1529436 RepID=UPI001425624B|nr:uncharacterized protein LOC117103628 [Anneissia japonica]XP_033100109.1 uncharacterized protein LOC117103628 [Anneissia japonica]XP_033100110.1 uncharacterized protein LOC117103628 [Anneissia japonica]XP_033100111.1 uncharacterized protein LOC117103628 [Anneissia japonica]